ncbi:dicarboxylate/amino acid:cation symporter [bacterium]|nr:dicarboxylate/amino acid:cation symporter [bacterium]
MDTRPIDPTAAPLPPSFARRAPAWLLPALLVAGATLGFVIGGVFGARWDDPSLAGFVGLVQLFGRVFMNVLKSLVVPLIVCSMVAGVAAVGDLRRVSGLFGFTFGYYLVTTVMAVSIGLGLVLIIRPGVTAMESVGAAVAPDVAGKTWYEALFSLIEGLFPPNLIQAAAETNVLGLILISIVLGALLTTLGGRGRRAIELVETLNDALLILVRFVVWFAPIGIIGLVADRVGRAGGGEAVATELIRLSRYFLTVMIGLAIHAGIVLPAILRVFAGRPATRHAGHVSEALLMAFSTASSAATLPVTIRNVRERAGISERASGFVLPMGATINMDGTALYEAVAAIFIAQAYGIELTVAQVLIVMLTATLAAIGAAAIPEAGLVTMVMVLTAVNVPVEGIGLLLSIDWLLDRFRTTVNVWGDTVGAAVVERRLANI